ncbi:mucin TcMUCII, partial [Trypanosoma cruzi]
MMMTCRLLCALLVLALCCCPSVCVKTSEGKAEKSGKVSVSGNPKPEGQVHVTKSPSPEEDTSRDQKTDVDARVKDTSPSGAAEGALRSSGESDPRSQESGAEQGRNAGAGPSSTAAGPESVGVSNTLQNHGTDGTPVPEISTRQSAEEANQEAEDPAEKTTTTTTTHAPTTTTTTAPEAPTTNTEAPTTTTSAP